MTALERAKRFVQSKAAKTALVIIPLAAAVPASAAPIDFNNSPSAMATTSTSEISVTPLGGGDTPMFLPLPDGGLKFTGGYDYEVTPGTIGSGGSTDFTISLLLTGLGNGEEITQDVIPAHFDYSFDLGGNAAFINFASSITFLINGTPVSPPNAFGTSGIGDPQLAGWLPGTTLDYWEVKLVATFNDSRLGPNGGAGVIRLTVPPNSIDIMPGGVATADPVPEPASLALLASGGVVLAFRRRRRQTSQE